MPLVEVIIFGVVPLVLLASRVVSSTYRFYLLSAVLVGIAVDVIFSDMSLVQLGLRTDNFVQACWLYAGSAVIGVAAIKLFARSQGILPVANWRQDRHLLFWFVPISIAQQFVFFGFLSTRLEALLPVQLAIFASALIFSGAHMMYEPRKRALAVTLIGGLMFSIFFSFMPNLLASSLCHMVLNFTVVQANLFNFNMRRPG